MTEQAQPTDSGDAQQEQDPDMKAVMGDEEEIFNQHLGAFREQYFQSRIVIIATANRKLVRENEELKARIKELEGDSESDN